MPYEKLAYRGNFALTRNVSYAETLLSAQYAGGFREDIIVGDTHGLNKWTLRYNALLNTQYIEVPGFDREPRDRYIWNFIQRSKGGGNLPFVLPCPMDNKDYLCVFTETDFTFEIVDFKLRTTGLQISQVFVRGVTVRSDGSLGDSV
jgi:hypothetical protein